MLSTSGAGLCLCAFSQICEDGPHCSPFDWNRIKSGVRRNSVLVAGQLMSPADIKVPVIWLWILIWFNRFCFFFLFAGYWSFLCSSFNEEHIVYHPNHILLFFFFLNYWLKIHSAIMFSKRYHSFNHVFLKCLHLQWVVTRYFLLDLHILVGAKVIFKPAVTCMMILGVIRAAPETCTLMCPSSNIVFILHF